MGKVKAKLIEIESGREIKKGDIVTSFRGEDAIVKGFEAPRHAASTGRVYVTSETGFGGQGYYPSVYGLKIVRG